MKPSAFAPGHITGFFEICDKGSKLEGKGSRGAGLCLDKGAISEVEVLPSNYQKIRIYINRKRSLAPTTDIAIKELIGDDNIEVKVKTKVQLPQYQGFGMSGAGALSACLALANLLGIDKSEAIKAAHIAEIKAKTGLGDVGPQTIGGFEVRVKPGIPPYGVIKKLSIGKEQSIVLGIVGEGVKTEHILKDKNKKRICSIHAKICLDEFERKPSIENFFRLSKQFVINTGLASIDTLAAIKACEPWGLAGQSMIGRSVFAIGDTKKLIKTLKKFGKVFICKLDGEGARLLRA
jgi:pantoate kinase